MADILSIIGLILVAIPSAIGIGVGVKLGGDFYDWFKRRMKDRKEHIKRNLEQTIKNLNTQLSTAQVSQAVQQIQTPTANLIVPEEIKNLKKDFEKKAKEQFEETKDKEEIKETNPMHYCMNGCGKQLNFRGFCSDKCHDEYFDDLMKAKEIEKNMKKKTEEAEEEILPEEPYSKPKRQYVKKKKQK